MNRAPRILLITLALSTITTPVVTPATPSTPCEALASLTLPNARIDSARMVAAGAFAAPGGARGGTSFATLPVFCRVTATLTPTSDSDIKTEFWLPASGWNGKFKAVGAGGWTGVIAYPALAAAVASGYAGAGNDTGYHLGGPAHVGPGHPEKLIDLGYRAMHEMTVQAKAVIKAHYGRAAKFSYYEGCSHGGRQGLAAAQMYPEDFNGIIAGAAGWDQMRVQSWRVALNLVVNRDAGSVIPPSKYSMIHEAALNACDGLDGVTDSVIENPATCRIDYTMLACKDGDSTDCLTSSQIESAKAMTSPLKDPKTGRVVFERHLMPGSEPGWAALAGPTPQASSVDILRTVVFADPSWDYHTMDLTIDFARAENADHGVLRSGDANLKPFFDRRWQAADVSRLERPPALSDEQHRVLQERARHGGQRQVRDFNRALHGARNGSLRRRCWYRQVRQDESHRGMGRAGPETALDYRIACDRRPRGQDAPALSVRAGRAGTRARALRTRRRTLRACRTRRLPPAGNGAAFRSWVILTGG